MQCLLDHSMLVDAAANSTDGALLQGSGQHHAHSQQPGPAGPGCHSTHRHSSAGRTCLAAPCLPLASNFRSCDAHAACGRSAAARKHPGQPLSKWHEGACWVSTTRQAVEGACMALCCGQMLGLSPCINAASPHMRARGACWPARPTTVTITTPSQTPCPILVRGPPCRPDQVLPPTGARGLARGTPLQNLSE